jgi:hypothetical protein
MAKTYVTERLNFVIKVEDLINQFIDSQKTTEEDIRALAKEIVFRGVEAEIGDRIGRLVETRAVNPWTFQPMYGFEFKIDPDVYHGTKENVWGFTGYSIESGDLFVKNRDRYIKDREARQSNAN